MQTRRMCHKVTRSQFDAFPRTVALLTDSAQKAANLEGPHPGPLQGGLRLILFDRAREASALVALKETRFEVLRGTIEISRRALVVAIVPSMVQYHYAVWISEATNLTKHHQDKSGLTYPTADLTKLPKEPMNRP